MAAAVAGCGFLRQPPRTPAVAPAAVVKVAADDIALAMQEDHFWSDYGQSRLQVQGTIASLGQENNDLTVVLSTTVETYVVCDMGNRPATLHAGDAVTVTALGADAERAPSAVILRKCALVTG